MRTDPHPCEVRDLVLRTFRDYGIEIEDPFDLDESILIDRGRCIGRRYRADGGWARWLSNAGIVEFYDAEGWMLHSVNLFEELRPLPLAA